MSTRPPDDVFNVPQFIADVQAWRNRHDVSTQELAKLGDLDRISVSRVVHGERGPTLHMACTLANICDLDLDSYRKVPARYVAP